MTGRRTQRGQAMVEYALIVSLWAAALFLPWPFLRHPVSGETMSVFMYFIAVFDTYINSFHTVITMPFP